MQKQIIATAQLIKLNFLCTKIKNKISMGTVLGTVSSEKSHSKLDMNSPKAVEVLEIIKKDKVVIFSKTYCPYCVMAKEQFQKLSSPYVTVELDTREDGDEVQEILGKLTGARTVPRVFINGKCVGGGTDVKALYADGTLKELVDSPNVTHCHPSKVQT